MARDTAGKARKGESRPGNAKRARGQAADKRTATPMSSGVARRGAKLPLDSVNKKPLGR